MTDQQIALFLGPTVVLCVVLAGYVLQTSNLNARSTDLRAELSARFGDLRADIRDQLQAERRSTESQLEAVRADMARNHSELLDKLADIETRLGG